MKNKILRCNICLCSNCKNAEKYNCINYCSNTDLGCVSYQVPIEECKAFEPLVLN